MNRGYRDLLDHMRLIAVGLDADGRVTYANRYFLELTGHGLDQVLGCDWCATFIPERERTEVGAVFTRTVSGQGPHHFENHILTRTGEQRAIRWNNTPLFDPKGTLSIGEDVTEQRRTERELIESEAGYRAIVETAIDGIITIDERGTIESCNRAAERIFGFDAVDLIGRNVSSLMPSPYCDEHDGYIADYMRTGEAKIIGRGREVLGRRRDGTMFPLYVGVGEFEYGGRRRFTGIVRDLTERRRAEHLAELGTLASSLAHEIGTPLSIILGRAELLRSQTQEERTSRSLDIVIGQVERVTRIIDQLLALTRRYPLERRRTDVNEVIRSTLDVLEDRLQRCGIELATELADDLPMASLDSVRIGQVILNLAMNAIDAMENGGQLRVATQLTRRDGDRVACIEMTVADNGCGLPSEHRERIFEPFFTTKEPGKGSGLGLSVVQGIVHDHAGELTVDSELGHGSEFRVRIPLRVENGAPEADRGTDGS